MTDEEFEQLKPFFLAASRANMIVQNLMMGNTPFEASITYERAVEEARRANVALDEARARILLGTIS